MHVITKEKEVTSPLKVSREGGMGDFRERKGKGNM